MKRGKIKAFIFDIGGVLYFERSSKSFKNHDHSGVHEYVARKLKLPLDTYFDSIDTTYTNSIEGKNTKQQVLSVLSKNLKLGKRKLERLYYNAYKKKFLRNKELYKKAYELKDKDFDIAILSDQWHLSKKAFITKKDLWKFDALVLSCDVGLRKPNPKIYKLVLKQLHLKPEEVVFIDNRNWNLVSAKKLGMKTILFENNEQLFRSLKRFGVK
jgi:putative hydrolase of the HAD superfamily